MRLGRGKARECIGFGGEGGQGREVGGGARRRGMSGGGGVESRCFDVVWIEDTQGGLKIWENMAISSSTAERRFPQVSFSKTRERERIATAAAAAADRKNTHRRRQIGRLDVTAGGFCF